MGCWHHILQLKVSDNSRVKSYICSLPHRGNLWCLAMLSRDFKETNKQNQKIHFRQPPAPLLHLSTGEDTTSPSPGAPFISIAQSQFARFLALSSTWYVAHPSHCPHSCLGTLCWHPNSADTTGFGLLCRYPLDTATHYGACGSATTSQLLLHTKPVGCAE